MNYNYQKPEKVLRREKRTRHRARDERWKSKSFGRRDEHERALFAIARNLHHQHRVLKQGKNEELSNEQ